MDVEVISAKWIEKEISLPVLVKLAIDESNLEPLGQVANRIEGVLQSTPSKFGVGLNDIQNPKYQLLYRNLTLVKNLRNYRMAEVSGQPLPTDGNALVPELAEELHRQREVMRPALEKARAEEKRLADLSQAQEKMVGIKKQFAEVSKEMHHLRAEIRRLEKGGQNA